jgi:hypothetical protein
VEGLRKAKESYQPDHMVANTWSCPREGPDSNPNHAGEAE